MTIVNIKTTEKKKVLVRGDMIKKPGIYQLVDSNSCGGQNYIGNLYLYAHTDITVPKLMIALIGIPGHRCLDSDDTYVRVESMDITNIVLETH